MKLLLAGAAALAAIVALGTDARAQCSDANVLAARQAIQAECGCPTSGRGAFLKCARKELKTATSDKACRKQAQREVANSICGRSDQFVVCCKAKGRKLGKIVGGSAKCKRGGVVCSGTSRMPVGQVFLTSVDDVCTAQSTCKTTTTTTTTTSSTSLPSLPTTTVPTTVPTTMVPTTTTLPGTADGGFLEFQLTSSAADCGRVTNDAAGTTAIAMLGCGGLNIGGGGAAVPPEGPTPDGSINRFGLRNCTGGVCEVIATVDPPATALGATKVDCSGPGCNFGTPLPISGAISTCVLNTFATAASGTIDLATGATTNLGVSLASNIFLSGPLYPVDRGNGVETLPCPSCVVDPDANDFRAASGTPAAPATGKCAGGARHGLACTSQNSGGLTNDCLPGGTSAGRQCLAPGPGVPDDATNCEDPLGISVKNLGSIAVDLTPLKTETVSRAAGNGIFCTELNPPQTRAGCFGAELALQGANGRNCRGIFADGQAFGDLSDGQPHDGVLASVFCIPLTGNGTVDIPTDLPGPGEVTLPGQMRFIPPTP